MFFTMLFWLLQLPPPQQPTFYDDLPTQAAASFPDWYIWVAILLLITLFMLAVLLGVVIYELRRQQKTLDTLAESVSHTFKLTLEIARMQLSEGKFEMQSFSSVQSKLNTILAQTRPKPAKVAGLRISFGKPIVNQKEKDSMSSPGNSFDAPDVDSVPYTVTLTDENGAPINPIPAGASVTLASDNSDASVVPNPNDPTGLTGTITAAKGYAGPVSGTAKYTDAEGNVESGTWSGTFDPTQPLGINVQFGTPTAPVPPAPAAA